MDGCLRGMGEERLGREILVTFVVEGRRVCGAEGLDERNVSMKAA